MRFHRKLELLISEDHINDPKKIRFKDSDEVTDIGTLQSLKTRSESFPVGSVSVDMTNITTGKYLFLKPDHNIQVRFDGESSPRTFLANKVSELWTTFTSLDIITTEITNIVIIVGGE